MTAGNSSEAGAAQGAAGVAEVLRLLDARVPPDVFRLSIPSGAYADVIRKWGYPNASKALGIATSIAAATKTATDLAPVHDLAEKLWEARESAGKVSRIINEAYEESFEARSKAEDLGLPPLTMADKLRLPHVYRARDPATAERVAGALGEIVRLLKEIGSELPTLVPLLQAHAVEALDSKGAPRKRAGQALARALRDAAALDPDLRSCLTPRGAFLIAGIAGLDDLPTSDAQLIAGEKRWTDKGRVGTATARRTDSSKAAIVARFARGDDDGHASAVIRRALRKTPQARRTKRGTNRHST